MQRAADQVRVNVQLIDALTDWHLWAESYDRDLTDIFGVESEVAAQLRRRCRPSSHLANPMLLPQRGR